MKINEGRKKKKNLLSGHCLILLKKKVTDHMDTIFVNIYFFGNERFTNFFRQSNMLGSLMIVEASNIIILCCAL